MINLSNANPIKKKFAQRLNTNRKNIKNLINKLNNKQNEIKNNNNINKNNNPIKLTTEENILNNNLQSQEDIHQINPKINKTKKNMKKKRFLQKIKNKKLNNQRLKYHIIQRNISSSKEKVITISCESISSERNSDKKKESEKNKEAFEKKKLYTPEYEKYNDLNYEDALNYDKRYFYQMFLAFLFQQHVIINTFFAEVFLELRAIKISFFIFGLEIGFFLMLYFILMIIFQILIIIMEFSISFHLFLSLYILS